MEEKLKWNVGKEGIVEKKEKLEEIGIKVYKEKED